jgi:hypothetical protein
MTEDTPPAGSRVPESATGIPAPVSAVWRGQEATVVLEIDGEGRASFLSQDGAVLARGSVHANTPPKNCELLRLELEPAAEGLPFVLDAPTRWPLCAVEVPCWIDHKGGAIRIGAPSDDPAIASRWTITTHPPPQNKPAAPPRAMVGRWYRHHHEERGGLVADPTEGSGFAVEDVETTEVDEAYLVWPDGRVLHLHRENCRTTSASRGWLTPSDSGLRYDVDTALMRSGEHALLKPDVPQLFQRCFLQPRPVGKPERLVAERRDHLRLVPDPDEATVPAGTVFHPQATCHPDSAPVASAPAGAGFTSFTCSELCTTRDRDGYDETHFRVRALLQLHDDGSALAHEDTGPAHSGEEDIAESAQLTGTWSQDAEGLIRLALERRTPAEVVNLSDYVNAAEYYAPPGVRRISVLHAGHFEAAFEGGTLCLVSGDWSLTLTLVGAPGARLVASEKAGRVLRRRLEEARRPKEKPAAAPSSNPDAAGTVAGKAQEPGIPTSDGCAKAFAISVIVVAGLAAVGIFGDALGGPGTWAVTAFGLFMCWHVMFRQ